MALRRSLDVLPIDILIFTVVLAERQGQLLTDNIEGLRAAFREVKQAHPFEIEAILGGRQVTSHTVGGDGVMGFCGWIDRLHQGDTTL